MIDDDDELDEPRDGNLGWSDRWPEPPTEPSLSPLRHQRSIERKEDVFTDGPIGPWGGRVYVDAIEGIRDARFMVGYRWIGPAAPGWEPADEVRGHDEWPLQDFELARGVAIAAAELLAVPVHPSLRHLADAIAADGSGWRGRYRDLVFEVYGEAHLPPE